MAKNTSKQSNVKNQINSFLHISSDIRSILSGFRKEIPEIVEKIVNDRLRNDWDKLSIMTPALEEFICFHDKHQGDADAPNQTRDKAALISNSPGLGSMAGKIRISNP